MKFFLVFLLLIAILYNVSARKNFLRTLGEPKLSKSRDPPKEQWFVQNLDHFNVVEGRTWKQVSGFTHHFFLLQKICKIYLRSFFLIFFSEVLSKL